MANLVKILVFVATNWKEIYSLTKVIIDALDGDGAGPVEKPVDHTFKKKGLVCQLTGVCK